TRWNREYRDIDFLRHIEHARIRLASQYLAGLRVNRVNGAAIAAIDQIFHHRVADLAVLGGGADHSDGARIHDAVHGVQNLALTEPLARRRLLADDDANVDCPRA